MEPPRQFRDLTASGYNPFAYTPPGKVPVEQRLPAPTDPTAGADQGSARAIGEAITERDHPRAAAVSGSCEARPRPGPLPPGPARHRQPARQPAALPDAAEAYELFLRHYKNFEQIEQVELMLG
jgi:hypothetical protein